MPRIKAISWVGLGLLSLGAVLCAGTLPSAVSESGRALDLPPEKPVRQGLREGESHEYRLPLAPGEVVDVTVVQEGVDVSLTLADPDGEDLLSMDTPKGSRGTERLFSFAEVGGMYRLRVKAGTGTGSYVLRLAKPRPAGPADRLRAQAWREYSQGKSLGGDPRRALVHYDKAIRLWQTFGDRDQQAIALYRRARILRDLNHLPQAVQTYASALPLVEDLSFRLSILNTLTNSQIDLGELQQAFQTAEQAREQASRAGDPVAQALALNNLGVIYRRWGETDKALKCFEGSLEKWREVGDRKEMANTLLNQADIHLAIGTPDRARTILGQALPLLEDSDNPGNQIQADRLLGLAFGQLGSSSLALGFLEEALEKARDAGNPSTEAQVFNDKGSALLKIERLGEAQAAFGEARRIAKDSQSLDNEAFALSGLGKVLLAQGKAVEAIDLFERSEQIYGRLGDPNSLALVLQGHARAERSLGRIEEALGTTERALDLVEGLREGVGQHDLRIHLIGARADLYDLKVDLLLRLHEKRPGEGFDAAAFAASEWRRARSLLEMVEKMAGGPPRDLSPESLRRQNDLRRRLQQLNQEKLKIASRIKTGHGRQGLSEIEREIQEALAEWEELSEEMRRQSPLYAAVSEPKLVGVPEVQALLDADTALLAYTVGEERSILWWIEKETLEVHQVPLKKAELESLAGESYDLLSSRSQTRQRGQTQKILSRLETSLLGPVAKRLPRVRKIAVVADETLQALPFAVLTAPGSQEPLVESHAIVQLPSASLVAALRARQQGRARPPQVMAVFGDPVFSLSDLRFGQRRPGSSIRPSELSRLLASSDEVEAILKLVPPHKSRQFIGFEATREAAMDPGLSQYQYIHIATHGSVDPDNPNLSGIQLSKLDPQGRDLEGDGFLPFYEVYNLSFPADLVTLSACRTVDGPLIRGEGRLGMSRSFLYAGASRVLGTLWYVEDKNAADLMTHFYQALLRDGKSPAVALQEAQKAMRANEATRAPYHWAGFVLQGDWR